ncbi:MAG: hypothetical protein ACLFWD_00380 [Anaerolineales bacterium]
MNPYTRSLLQEIDDEPLSRWVETWGQLEHLIIQVYRSGQVEAAEQEKYKALRDDLTRGYPRWQAQLKPHWKDLRAGGENLQADPFLHLTAAASLTAFIGNWEAMQKLPAAREAINHFLLSRIETGQGRHDS